MKKKTTEGNKKKHIAEIRLNKFLPHRLSLLSNIVSRTIASAYAKEFDISIAEWRVVAILHSYPGISSGEVSAKTGMDEVAVSRAVSHLYRAKFITRHASPEDRRKTVLDLSEAGQELYSNVTPVALSYERELLKGLSKQQHQELNDLLDKLQDKALKLNTSMNQTI